VIADGMLVKRTIRVGNSVGITFDKPIREMVGIEAGDDLQMYVDEGAIVLRPVENRASRSRLPTTRPLTMLMRSLDDEGLTTTHFERLRNDDATLGELTGRIEHGQPVDAVTLERLKMCLSRRETCKESWDATIMAVLAVRSSSDTSDT
jgi:bifunctional DNA-binding transcriptional regulator/antitoxin component of YhaV-PrlF toxin-antitoxin module